MLPGIEELITHRRTVHEYLPEPVDSSLVEKALELALWAPNHKHTKPWRFYWVKAPAVRDAIAELGVRLKAEQADKSLSEPVQNAIRAKFTNPSDLVVLLQDVQVSDFQRREDYATIAMGVQNMSLHLWANGIGTKWSSGGLTKHDEVYKLLGVSKEQQEIVGFLWIGKPTKIPATPDKANLSEVLTVVE